MRSWFCFLFFWKGVFLEHPNNIKYHWPINFSALHSACSNHKLLNSDCRHVNTHTFGSGGCGSCDNSGKQYAMSDWKGSSWYRCKLAKTVEHNSFLEYADCPLSKQNIRFTGSAGSQMPTSPVGKERCGAHATGWLSGPCCYLSSHLHSNTYDVNNRWASHHRAGPSVKNCLLPLDFRILWMELQY